MAYSPDTTTKCNMKDLIENQDWDDIIKRLTLYASRLVASKSWLRAPGGKKGEDYAMNAIGKLFESGKTGTRKWNPERVSLYVFLKGIVRSDVSTDVESAENIRTLRLTDHVDAKSSSDTTLMELIDAFSDDDNVVKAIEAFIDGATDKEIKDTLGVKRAELARIKNCLREYFELKTPEKQQRKSNL